MQKYFILKDDFENRRVNDLDSFHIINVMRQKVGDSILIGYDNKTYLSKIISLKNKIVEFEIVEEIAGNHEMPAFVTIFQGYPKGDKIEDIIKHGTELGAYSFQLVITKRSVVKIDEKKIDNKLIRFNKIAKEAAEQSYRDIVPKVEGIKELKEFNFDLFDKKILCYEKMKDDSLTFKKIVSSIKPNEKVAIFVGPEGGIDEAEVKYLESKGFISCGLGPRILRCETAPLYVLSAISFETELK